MGFSVDPKEQHNRKKLKTLARTQKSRAKTQEKKAIDAHSPIVLFFVGNDDLGFESTQVTHPTAADVDNNPDLFSNSNASSISYNQEKEPIGFHTDVETISPQLIHNCCILLLNKVAKSTDQHPPMTVTCDNHILAMDVNEVHRSQIAYWTAKGENLLLDSELGLDDDSTGFWTSPDNNHFIGLDFIKAYEKVDQKRNNINAPLRAKPRVYFANRSTLVDILKNKESKRRCLNFIQDNFDFVFQCNTGKYVKSTRIKITDFFSDVRIHACTPVYPPPSMVKQCEDKFEMKSTIGDLGLPYVLTFLPRDNLEASAWNNMTWHLLFTEFASQFDTIQADDLEGIVFKPRIGECGQGIIIISRELRGELGEDNYTVTPLNHKGPPPGKPSDLIPWYPTVKTGYYYVEPYVSGDLNEHRFIIATANNGRGMNALYNCTVGVQLESGLYQFQDHLRPADTVEEVYSSSGSTNSIFTGIHTKFFQMMKRTYGDKRKWPAFMKGQVYRVDAFVNTCYLDVEPQKRYYINEFGLVPLDVPFIRTRHESMGVNTTPFPQMIASQYADFVKAYHQTSDFP